MKILLFVFALFTLPAFGQAPTASIIQLIANPEKYDGKVVIFEGVTNLEFEGNAVYLSKEHWKHSLSSFGISLYVDAKLFQKRKWANGLYCILNGTFRASDRGHEGLYMGTLTDITMFQVREAVSPKDV